MKENRFKRFKCAERRNNEVIVKKNGELWEERNWKPGGRPKNNWIKAIRRDMRAFGVEMVRSREERDTSNWYYMRRIKVNMKKVVLYNQNI